MTQWEALAIILLLMALGDILSKISKGKVPSAHSCPALPYSL